VSTTHFFFPSRQYRHKGIPAGLLVHHALAQQRGTQRHPRGQFAQSYLGGGFELFTQLDARVGYVGEGVTDGLDIELVCGERSGGVSCCDQGIGKVEFHCYLKSFSELRLLSEASVFVLTSELGNGGV
jgi:hypothetical protein